MGIKLKMKMNGDYRLETIDETFDRTTEEKLKIQDMVAWCYADFEHDVYDFCKNENIDNADLIEKTIYQYLYKSIHPERPSTTLTPLFGEKVVRDE